MAGLEKVGIPGPDHLREALTNCTDPLAAIEEFQTENGIQLHSLPAALPFLDLHGVQRVDFHGSIMEDLRERLLQRVTELAEKGDKNKYKILNDLLSKCFPVVKVKALRPVVLWIMKHLPKIKAEYLQVVTKDAELYKEAAVEVKQQIWQDNQSLFGDEVSPLLSKYIDDREKILFDQEDPLPTFLNQTPKFRRSDEVVQQLAKMVGKNIKLYDMVLQFLRTLYLRTRNVHYCTLRAELLMALHDNEVNEIVAIDPCHKFTWCLDACIRERFVDVKRSRELQGFLDSIRRGQEVVLGELSMILCDPHSVYTLAQSVFKTIQNCISSETLPRNNEDLVILLRMLSLGLSAWHMIDSQAFKEIKLDSIFVSRFLPSLMALMVDDQMNAMSSKETQSHVEQQATYVLSQARDNNIAATLVVHYLLNAAKHKDAAALINMLPLVAACDTDTVYDDVNLHTLTSHLMSMAELFTRPDICEAVFDQFFLPFISRENVLRHLLRLIWWVHHKVIPATLEKLLKVLEPNNQHSETVHTVYQALGEKIQAYQPSPVVEPKKLDSPLMSVPAPTPAHP